MCLAVPGKLLSISDNESMMRTGRVSFGGVVRKVNLAFVPDATIDDYVLVHAGVAIQVVDEEEARKTYEYLNEIGISAASEGDDDEVR